MSKVLLAVDTETKTVTLKVDGQEVPDVGSFNLGFYNVYCSECESYDCKHDLDDSLSVNFSVEKEVEGKNTETRIHYCLDNRKNSEATYAGFKPFDKQTDQTFTKVKGIHPNIKDAIAKLFK